MRTTLTLEDDVAARLEHMRKQKNLSTKQLINISLRADFDQLESEGNQSRSEYKIKSVTLGKTIPSLDNIAEVLALLDRK